MCVTVYVLVHECILYIQVLGRQGGCQGRVFRSSDPKDPGLLGLCGLAIRLVLYPVITYSVLWRYAWTRDPKRIGDGTLTASAARAAGVCGTGGRSGSADGAS